MNKYQYILFDLDGTLTDPKIGITTCFQYALKHMGIHEDNLDNLEKVIGPPLKDSFMEFYGLTEDEALLAVDKYRERFATIGIFENRLYDGIIPMLKELKKAGKQLAIASSKPEVFVKEICDYFQITEYFHHINGSCLDGQRSLKSQVVAFALEQFQEYSLSQVIMVGDRKFDVEGAHENKIEAIGVTFGYGGLEELQNAQADYIVQSVSELSDLLLQS